MLRLIVSILLLLATWLAIRRDAPFLAIATGFLFAYAVSHPIVHGLFGIPAAMRWLRYRRWQGRHLAFDDVHIRALPGENPVDHYVIALEDVERALGIKFDRVSTEFVPTEGLLKGLRCVPADALAGLMHLRKTGGLPADRARSAHFARWLRDTMITQVEKERERDRIAAAQRSG